MVPINQLEKRQKNKTKQNKTINLFCTMFHYLSNTDTLQQTLYLGRLYCRKVGLRHSGPRLADQQLAQG